MPIGWTVLLVFYALIGLDNVLEAPSCGSGFWHCWPDKATVFFLWPLQALRGIYTLAVIIYRARKAPTEKAPPNDSPA